MITQLQAEILSRLDGQHVARRLKLATTRIRRLVKSKIRKARSLSLAWYRRQYFLAAAYGDMRVAVRRNEDIFIAITVIAITIAYAYVVMASEIFYTFFMTAFSVSEASGANIFVISAIAAGSLAVTFAWLAGFVLNSISIAIMQGANRNQIRSTRATLRQALRYTSRTTLYWLLFVVLVAIPIAAVSLLALLYMSHFADTLAEAFEVIQYAIIAAIAGALYVLLYYTLVPVVALFEPGLTMRQVLARSRELVGNRGKLFVLAGYGLLAAVSSVAYGLSRLLQDLTGLHSALTFSLSLLPILMCASGIMTMFYRNRRLARTR
ncbi:MAG: hypothetical protein ACR2FM_00395 [Candidatus Saccharimonadales bacterium]